MDLTLDERRLLAEFRKLPPAGRDELLAHAARLACLAGAEAQPETAAPADRCSLKCPEPRPEAEKGPIFTE